MYKRSTFDFMAYLKLPTFVTSKRLEGKGKTKPKVEDDQKVIVIPPFHICKSFFFFLFLSLFFRSLSCIAPVKKTDKNRSVNQVVEDADGCVRALFWVLALSSKNHDSSDSFPHDMSVQGGQSNCQYQEKDVGDLAFSVTLQL